MNQTIIYVRKDFNSSSEYSFTIEQANKSHKVLGSIYATRGLLNAGLLLDGRRVMNIPQGDEMFQNAAAFFASKHGINEFTLKNLD